MTMENLLVLQLVSAALALALVAVAVMNGLGPARRWGALALGALLIATIYAAQANLLGYPKPARLEPGTIDRAVIAVHMVEGEAIYVWVPDEGGSRPISLSLPWDDRVARAAREARRQADGRGTGMRMRSASRMRMPDDEPLFYAAPQPALPPKREGRS
jgi:hypothetical protein